ncbi:MAG: protein kinase [Alphaproteobacteria bacterium]|nr:protein kinase [Alphaproteobacteria bacterium]MCB9699291.1 protein kinase [Alphaproteobacteria bacterium]
MSDEHPFRFQDLGEIGRGGMSTVRRVHDPLLLRDTAIKFLVPGRDVARSRSRFLDEARITAQLQHPNIVPLYEYGTDPTGRDFIQMKLVQGQSLLDRIREAGEERLDPVHLEETLQILLRVIDAVDYAHSRDIVHRDLKPSNIMIGEFGEVYVMDWGIALRTGTVGEEPETFDERNVLGTPTFVAPEQIDDPDGVDERADIYCLGGILYALLTGRAPHQGRTPMLRLMASAHGRITPPEDLVTDGRLPIALCRIVKRAMARNPDDRYATVGELRNDIKAFLSGSWNLPTRHVPEGTVVVREGDPGHEAYVIKSGRCRVYNETQGDIRVLGPGDVFGELAILQQGGVRTSSVAAVTELDLLVVTRDVLTEGLGLHSWMGVFVKALANRFAELEQRLLP